VSLPLLLREYEEDDRNWVLSGWLCEQRRAFAWTSKKVYHKEIERRLDWTLKNGYCIVAANPDDPRFLYGTVLWTTSPAAVHWLFVRPAFRSGCQPPGQPAPRIGTSLVGAALRSINPTRGDDEPAPEPVLHTSCYTEYSVRILNATPGRFIYDPRAMRGGGTKEKRL